MTNETKKTTTVTSGTAPPRWAVLGVLFGILSAASIALFGPIGVSGTYSRFVGAVARRTIPAFAADHPYVVKMGSVVTPETMLVIGLFIGGFLAFRTGRGSAEEARSITIVHAQETTRARRYADAFFGGVLILFGARLAGGCTSGHIISGMTQLAVSSTIFAAAVFAGGIGVAHLVKAGGTTS